MNWREIWERKYRERAGAGIKGELSSEYWDKVAEDYSQWNKSNNYEYGTKAIEAIGEIINPDFEALDIGAGPGTLAIPLARVVGKMTAIEPSPVMVRHLLKNAQEQGVQNIEVIDKSWQEVHDPDISKRFDIVACSHLLWQFEEVDRQLKRMEEASRGYCCVVHPAGERDTMIESLWLEVVKREYAGELDPDLDDLVFVILRQRGILVNVKVVDYAVKLSLEQEVRLIARLVGKWVKMTPPLRRLIAEHVMEKSPNGTYEARRNAVVLWWKVPSNE
jgi:ubiquinone/menaquinone biosynthesis C-methylase UbiE